MENLIVQAKKKITLDKFVSSVKILTTNEIKTVLNISARAVFSQVEQSNNVITLSGKLFANVIYLSQDNQILSAETTMDFIEKQHIQVALQDRCAIDEVSIKVDTFSGTEILCSATHNTHIFGIYSYEIADFVGENTAFVLNKKTFNSKKFVTACSDNFVVAEEQESNILNLKVLESKAKILNYEASAGVDKIIVSGKLLVETIYDDGELSVMSKDFEFKQEIEAQGTVPNMFVDAILNVNSVTVTPEERENKTNVVYVIDTFAKGYVYEDHEYEIATDMFALDSEIQNTFEFLEFKNFSSENAASDIFMSTTDVSNIENFDDIVGVFDAKTKTKEIVYLNDKSIIDFEVSAFALYKSGESVKRLEVLHAAKFEFEKKQEEFVDDVRLVAEISSFKVKAGKELEVAFKVSAEVKNVTQVSEKYVKAYEIKEAKTTSNDGIKVYVTREGETLFDVAKVLSVRPEIIEEQNQIDGVFETGEKIYVYSPINIS